VSYTGRAQPSLPSRERRERRERLAVTETTLMEQRYMFPGCVLRGNC